MAPKRLRRGDHSSLITDRRHAILSQKYRSIEVHDVTQLTENESRCHAKRGAEHVAHHYRQPQPARALRHLEPLGQAPTFVELDVDDVIATRQHLNVFEL